MRPGGGTSCRRESAGDAFPAATLANKAHSLATRDREADAIDRSDHAVVGGELGAELSDFNQRWWAVLHSVPCPAGWNRRLVGAALAGRSRGPVRGAARVVSCVGTASGRFSQGGPGRGELPSACSRSRRRIHVEADWSWVFVLGASVWIAAPGDGASLARQLSQPEPHYTMGEGPRDPGGFRDRH